MQEQFQFIVDLATQYKRFTEQPTELYKAINQLSEDAVREIYAEFGSKESFQPVNLLRAELARQLLEGSPITESSIEKIKEHIRNKNAGYFSHINERILKQMA